MNEKNYKMTNESVFVFDDIFNKGFTVIPNEIFDDERLSDKAIGLYCRIIRRRNIDGWKVYQKNLVTKKCKKDTISTAINELISAGWIEKTQLRNKMGQLAGIQYKIYSTSLNLENTDVEPKTENPFSVNATSENPTLKNKDNKNKDNINKSIYQSNDMIDGQKEKIENNNNNEKENINKLVEELKKEGLTEYSKIELLMMLKASKWNTEIVIEAYNNMLKFSLAKFNKDEEHQIENSVSYLIKSIKNIVMDIGDYI